MPTLAHIDFPSDDIERSKQFYEKLFNWKIEKTPGDMEYYFVKSEPEGDFPGFTGGMGKRGAPDQKITNYFNVSSIDESIKKVEELGGKVIQPKMPVPGFGYLAVCMDTENNTFGLWEDKKEI